MTYTSDELLTALRDCMADEGSWVMADTVARSLGKPGDRPSAVGVGQRLSRLAKAGECERRADASNGMSVYRLRKAP